MRRIAQLCAVSLVALGAASCRAQEKYEAEQAKTTQPAESVRVTEESPGLLAKAKIRPEEAQKIALREVPSGTITKGELEEEEGKLIYSFDIKTPGREGVTELHVDAATGSVIKTEHEGPGREAEEDRTGR